MIKLVVPSLEDMWFREQLINDEKTIEFNKKWGGTIHFPKDKWESWYDYWVRNPDGKRFYRYILDDNNMFVGDEVHHLRLCATCTVDQSMYSGAHLFE